VSDIQFLSDVEVKLIDKMGGDRSVVQAARVSVQGENELGLDLTLWDEDDDDTKKERRRKERGLINYLMRERHGSPFEHATLKFYVKAPIFVFREFHRHRAGWSYNEMSGRYTELPGEFFVPDSSRPLVNIGKPSAPEFVAGSYQQVAEVQGTLTRSYTRSWDEYQRLLNAGIAPEVARSVLPVGIMSQMYATANLRAIMHFLSLRTLNKPNATFKSRPQQEIAMVGDKMEAIFKDKFPVVHSLWEAHGRVAP
jgi:thymidylate synthase (FAD)